MYPHAMREDFPPVNGNANQLQGAASSYLRSAQHQPIYWHAWGEEAFARAQAEDKPVLLDIGAVWCHWCHVMDRESYEDPEIAAIINEHFVAVKVDRDERPDVDARYQSAVSAISGQGGWPLTAFLTPDGKPFFGGTYIPRHNSFGRAGMDQVLLAMAQVWQERREEALETAGKVMGAISRTVGDGQGASNGHLSLALVDAIVGSELSQFDPVYGGFGTQPKFPHPAALDLLLQVAKSRENGRKGNEQALKVFTVTLEKMAQGGVYDQLAGGFHRYSVDERWVVPHFEKMLYDNTELLRNYVHGYQSLGREDFLVVAMEIIGWLNEGMTDRAQGGFFASQDADIDLDDDGDYFTWTLDEARAVLNPAELELAALHWDIGEAGEMHHNPAKNVLFVKQTAAELAARIDNTSGRSAAEVDTILGVARRKLLAARGRRSTPFIDRTLYTGWNAMAVTAYLEAARVLQMDSARDFALRTLERLLSEAWDGGDTLNHVIAYGSSYDKRGVDAEIPLGNLDDYAFTIHACIDGWFASGEMNFYHAAVKLADAMIALFYDRTAAAFNDTATIDGDRPPLGALEARRQPVEDTPTPAGNPTAASALLRLETLSGRQEYRQIAEETLDSFSETAGRLGLFAGSYGLAVERLLTDPIQVVVVGSGPEALELEALALARFAVNKTVMRIDSHRLVPGGIPEALAQMLLQVPPPAGAEAWAMVCRDRSCRPPVTTAKSLKEVLEN
jgi:uncharacterized protein YyaL (SSP411 family)